MDGINKGSKAQLTVESISNIGPHYARTLREWRQAFLEKFDDVIAPALKSEYPEIMKGDKGAQEAEVFKRKWICRLFLSQPDYFLIRLGTDYYCYCEVGFTTRYIGDHIITFTRDGSEDYGCAVYE
jgi:cyclopropane-fatty-acyl-phospholipid synthase